MTDRAETPGDEQIVELIRTGSVDEGVRLLLARHGSTVKGALAERFGEMHSHDLEQAIHDAVIRIWRRIDAFDPAAGSLRGWLHAVAKNYLLDQLRAREARPLFESAEVEFLDALPDGTETRGEWTARMLVALRSCIGELSPMQQDILLSGLAAADADDQQIANRWNTTANTIRVARHKSRRRLGDLMKAALQ